MKLLSEKVASDLQDISGLLFTGNSIVDNMVYALEVDFVMPNTSEMVHSKIAHEMPLLADEITEYAASRNVKLHRPVVPANKKDYNNIKEIFDEFLEYMVDLERMVSKVIDDCVEEDDKTTKAVLSSFLKELIPYTKMALGFVDYVEKCGYTDKDCMFIDFSINHFMGLDTIND